MMRFDPTFVFLLISNLITMYMAISEGWNLQSIMWVYWWQSVVIGIFNFIRMWESKRLMAIFFLFHYGLFHFVYMIFLIVGSFLSGMGLGSGPTNMDQIFVAGIIFLVNHWYSYTYYRSKESNNRSLMWMMAMPYIRIIPMHLTIILGVNFGGSLGLFLGLKTVTDLVLHLFEHRRYNLTTTKLVA